MKKICPTCKKIYDGLKCYCTKCGVELVKEPNRCSENKKALCQGNILEGEIKEKMSW